MDNFTRCSDTNDTLDGFKLSKGKGVVSILWSTAWTNNIKMFDDGNERIIAILISASTVAFLNKHFQDFIMFI
jgi:hypothetical protein